MRVWKDQKTRFLALDLLNKADCDVKDCSTITDSSKMSLIRGSCARNSRKSRKGRATALFEAQLWSELRDPELIGSLPTKPNFVDYGASSNLCRQGCVRQGCV
jgi:hypothetical protein